MSRGGRSVDPPRSTPTVLETLGELAATAIALAAATASGALLLAIAGSGSATLKDLLRSVALPGLVALIMVLALALALHWRRLANGILVGFWIGIVATIGLEIVREIGFRVFDSMPGDLPMLMGVMATGRMVMQGPSIGSNIAGWGDHFFNGAMFGIIYVLLLGGFPRRGRAWAGVGTGAFYGFILGTGFLLSPAATMTGAGIFGSNVGPKFAITVYLAHVLFGGLLGLLAHRFGKAVPPIWTPVFGLLKQLTGHAMDQQAEQPVKGH